MNDIPGRVERQGCPYPDAQKKEEKERNHFSSLK